MQVVLSGSPKKRQFWSDPTATKAYYSPQFRWSVLDVLFSLPADNAGPQLSCQEHSR